VLAGKVAAADVAKLDGKTATTLNGAVLKVSTNGGVKLNGEVNSTKTDLAASNGLIRVVDSVLMPKQVHRLCGHKYKLSPPCQPGIDPGLAADSCAFAD
jgi:uncharacterized surface protein with fasciclin (FAS1) repeats